MKRIRQLCIVASLLIILFFIYQTEKRIVEGASDGTKYDKDEDYLVRNTSLLKNCDKKLKKNETFLMSMIKVNGGLMNTKLNDLKNEIREIKKRLDEN